MKFFSRVIITIRIHYYSYIIICCAATYTDPCKRNDKNFSGCLKNTLQYLIPKFSKGKHARPVQSVHLK